MTEDGEVEKNFRSSYYGSLGFRAGEKSLGYLKGLLKAEVLDVEKLKLFCLKHTLPAYYRPLVWKVTLGVVPAYSNKETCSHVKDQRDQQFQDLRRALQVMGRIPATGHPSHTPAATTTTATSTSAHRTHQTKASPEDFVLIYLLQSNRLLSPSVNQMREEAQVGLCAIALPFLSLFEEETEAYWLFSRFAQRWETQLHHVQFMQALCLQSLREVDSVLYEHLISLDSSDHKMLFERWFNQCFAGVLPEPYLESVWDKVIAGSCAVLAYVVVAILLSLKRQLLLIKTASDITKLLNTIPKDNFGLIVSKAIELWESHGSPLTLLTPSSSYK